MKASEDNLTIGLKVNNRSIDFSPAQIMNCQCSLESVIR